MLRNSDVTENKVRTVTWNDSSHVGKADPEWTAVLKSIGKCLKLSLDQEKETVRLTTGRQCLMLIKTIKPITSLSISSGVFFLKKNVLQTKISGKKYCEERYEA